VREQDPLHLPDVLKWWTVVPRIPFSNSHCGFVLFFSSFSHSRHFHFHPISTRQRHQRSRANCRRTRPRPHSGYHFHPSYPARIRRLILNSSHCHPWHTIIASIAPASRAWRISSLWHVDGGQQEKQQQQVASHTQSNPPTVLGSFRQLPLQGH
jgi:hypothetical protein